MDRKVMKYIGTVLSGKKFNRKFPRRQFIKLTNYDERHNGYQFKDGLNVNTEPFNPSGSCRYGGIYFVDGLNIMIK